MTVRPCACGCGKTARIGEYNSDCKVVCKCGCGGRTRYAYISGHGPSVVQCSRCSKSVAPKMGDGLCSQCRRHLTAGRPKIKDVQLISARKMQAASPPGKKWCSGCERYRAVSFFGGYTEGGKKKTYSRCKPCFLDQNRARNVQRYNITWDQYKAMKEAQGGKCAICQRANGLVKALAVDHDHSCCPAGGSCGKCVRGLLCSKCNKNVLGHLRDDPAALQRAIDYLQNPPAHKVVARLTLNGDE